MNTDKTQARMPDEMLRIASGVLAALCIVALFVMFAWNPMLRAL